MIVLLRVYFVDTLGNVLLRKFSIFLHLKLYKLLDLLQTNNTT